MNNIERYRNLINEYDTLVNELNDIDMNIVSLKNYRWIKLIVLGGGVSRHEIDIDKYKCTRTITVSLIAELEELKKPILEKISKINNMILIKK